MKSGILRLGGVNLTTHLYLVAGMWSTEILTGGFLGKHKEKQNFEDLGLDGNVIKIHSRDRMGRSGVDSSGLL